jgi:SAM-dependent methyltransferase
VSVIWHDLECGAYTADLTLWMELADRHGDPILDVGAGTGRVTLELAHRGHAVTALDLDAELLAELTRRAEGLPVQTVRGDARGFSLGQRFALCLAPMQIIQLLGGRTERAEFLTRARRHLAPGGLLAVAIAESVEAYEALDGVPGPLPDMIERSGVVYSSLPTAVRVDGRGFVLERRRERIGARGERSVADDVVLLHRLTADELEGEARAVGLRPAGRREIPDTDEHVGSMVVMLGA